MKERNLNGFFKLIQHLVWLAVGFGLIYNHVTHFPVTFILIIAFIIAFTLLRKGQLSELGIKKFGWKQLRIAIVVFVVIELTMDFIIQPLISRIAHEPADYSSFMFIKNDPAAYLKWLVYIWISAAMGEELLFRAFTTERLQKAGINNFYLQILISASLFSLPHVYQGGTGLAVTFLFGVFFALLHKRYQNIGINILVHGLTDTLSLTLSYFGLLSFYQL